VSAQGLVRIERDGDVAELILDRPDRLNTFDTALTSALAAAVAELRDDRTIRAVVVAGEGKAFSAGADIAEFSALPDGKAFGEFLVHLEGAFARLSELPQPTVAAVHGVAYGGGMELALACDFRVAEERARFGLPEIKLGILPGAGGTQRTPRLLPPSVALRMILTGEPIGADDAHRLGFVEQVAPAGEGRRVAHELAARLAVLPPLAIAAAKRLVRDGSALPLEDALLLEREAEVELFDTADRAEGTAAFLEKRKPRFEGR
jgi:enoyl-CoA hydratase